MYENEKRSVWPCLGLRRAGILLKPGQCPQVIEPLEYLLQELSLLVLWGCCMYMQVYS